MGRGHRTSDPLPIPCVGPGACPEPPHLQREINPLGTWGSPGQTPVGLPNLWAAGLGGKRPRKQERGGAGSPKPWEHCGNRWRRKTARGEPCRGEAAELETATAGGEMKQGRERRAHLSPAAAAAAVPGRQSCLQHRECKHSLPGTARCPQLPEPWPGVREGHKLRFWLNFNYFSPSLRWENSSWGQLITSPGSFPKHPAPSHSFPGAEGWPGDIGLGHGSGGACSIPGETPVLAANLARRQEGNSRNDFPGARGG